MRVGSEIWRVSNILQLVSMIKMKSKENEDLIQHINKILGIITEERFCDKER